MQKMRIRKNGKIICENIELAESYTERVKGLSGRKQPGSDGMLMVFPSEAKHTIWMPNMKFPIDIVFIGGDKGGKRVVDIRENARPLSFNPKTWRIYRPKERAKYVLELPAGSAKNKISVGNVLQFKISKAKGMKA